MFGLFLGSYEEHLLARLGNVAESVSSLFDLSGGLVEVYDVDTVALHEDIGRHSGVPFTFEVSEMATCFEELVKCWS